MPKISPQAFNEKARKIRKNVISDLDEYYSDPDEWRDAVTDLVKFAIFYSNSCNQLLKASFLYSYDIGSFAQTILTQEPCAELNKDKFRPHHYSLLMKYTLDRVVVGLLLNCKIDKVKLEEASDYHYKSLNEYGFANESDAINELDANSMLSTFVPQMIVNGLLGRDYSNVVKIINHNIRPSEKIWMYAWRLLNSIFAGKNPLNTPYWSDLVMEWRACFIRMDFHGFNNTHLVLVYCLCCQASGRAFSIRDLSQQLLW